MERLRIDVRRIAAQLRGTFAIDEERAAKHPVLAHEIFDGADLLFLVFPLPRGLGRKDAAGIRGSEQQAGTSHAGGDQEPTTCIKRIAH